MLVNEMPVTVMESMTTNIGSTLLELSHVRPVMLVFLRHFGCTFCREALSDIAMQRGEIEQKGMQIIFVHMTDEDTAHKYFERFHLEGAIHISDPECRYYQAFGLVKGSFNQLFGLATWIRGFSAGVVAGHGIGPQLGDGFQMPGVFVIHEGAIKSSFIHKLASDRPDYFQLAQDCAFS